jgi:hypothetical protein
MENDETKRRVERIIKYNEKFNVPIQTEKEEAETFENAKFKILQMKMK